MMSRATPGWLSLAAAILLLHTLGFDSPHTKQIVFAVAIALQLQPESARAWLAGHVLNILQYTVISLCIFFLVRSLLATRNTPRWTGKGNVLLFPCKTTHARLFPKKHSFDYSYLVVGIPVGWEGVSGGMVSSFSAKRHSWFSLPRKGWYHINPEDYLDRGDGHLGLRGKMDAYLESQVCTGRVGQKCARC